MFLINKLLLFLSGRVDSPRIGYLIMQSQILPKQLIFQDRNSLCLYPLTCQTWINLRLNSSILHTALRVSERCNPLHYIKACLPVDGSIPTRGNERGCHEEKTFWIILSLAFLFQSSSIIWDNLTDFYMGAYFAFAKFGHFVKQWYWMSYWEVLNHQSSASVTCFSK